MQARFVIPLIIFIAIAIGLAVGLTLQPQTIPSALIGKPAPDFQLGPIPEYGPGLGWSDLIGQTSVVNVFASWCIPCRIEHPLWVEFAAENEALLFGLNYKDPPDEASKWLAKYGNPYTRIGSDPDGRVGIDWGVYGVPETFVIDSRGIIRLKHIGPIDRYILDNKILPIVQRLTAK